MTRIIHHPSAAGPDPAIRVFEENGSCIRTDTVYVVYTSMDETLAAVRAAADLANALRVPVTLIHFRTVPYPLPPDARSGVSPVETDEFAERVRTEGFDVRLGVYLCRSPDRAILLAFKRHSLIVVAGRRRWWPTRSERWRRRLESAGHFVLFVDTSEHKGQSHA